MHGSVMEYGLDKIDEAMIKGKDVIELGSRFINGTVYDHTKALGPKSHKGIDYIAGRCVDQVLDIVKLREHYEENSVDVIITTELMEHVKEWRKVIQNMKEVLKVGGTLFLTTRSKGFPLHSYPHDYWRYEIADMEYIFGDMEIIDLRIDPMKSHPGVFIIAKKTEETGTVDLSKLELLHV